MIGLYRFIYALAVIVLLLPEYLKRPPDVRKRWLREKFGFFGKDGEDRKKSIWVHAVSVGEVTAALPLLRRLKTAYPDKDLIVSTITDTGQKVAAEKTPPGTRIIYLPFDTKSALERSIRALNPSAFIGMETELWPCLFVALADHSIPILLLNGRISGKSASGYKKISFFMRRVLAPVTAFGMQSDADADRIIAIGADASKVRVTGNFKFDMVLTAPMPQWCSGLEGPVIVAGSTNDGEEELILAACRENLGHFPCLKLVLAPRHPERFAAVETLLRSSGIKYIKRSDMKEGSSGGEIYDVRVVLLDTVGELTSVYGAADIAVIGKSFKGIGGQNPLEPAWWGRPVICGPHMENFPFIKDFYLEGAAFETLPSQLSGRIRGLLQNPEKAQAAGKRAKELLDMHSGAVDRAMDIIKGCLAQGR